MKYEKRINTRNKGSLPELLELLADSLDDDLLLLDSLELLLELLLLLLELLALLESLGSGVFRFKIFFIKSSKFPFRCVMLLANLFSMFF